MPKRDSLLVRNELTFGRLNSVNPVLNQTFLRFPRKTEKCSKQTSDILKRDLLLVWILSQSWDPKGLNIEPIQGLKSCQSKVWFSGYLRSRRRSIIRISEVQKEARNPESRTQYSDLRNPKTGNPWTRPCDSWTRDSDLGNTQSPPPSGLVWLAKHHHLWCLQTWDYHHLRPWNPESWILRLEVSSQPKARSEYSEKRPPFGPIQGLNSWPPIRIPNLRSDLRYSEYWTSDILRFRPPKVVISDLRLGPRIGSKQTSDILKRDSLLNTFWAPESVQKEVKKRQKSHRFWTAEQCKSRTNHHLFELFLGNQKPSLFDPRIKPKGGLVLSQKKVWKEAQKVWILSQSEVQKWANLRSNIQNIWGLIGGQNGVNNQNIWGPKGGQESWIFRPSGWWSGILNPDVLQARRRSE